MKILFRPSFWTQFMFFVASKSISSLGWQSKEILPKNQLLRNYCIISRLTAQRLAFDFSFATYLFRGMRAYENAGLIVNCFEIDPDSLVARPLDRQPSAVRFLLARCSEVAVSLQAATEQKPLKKTLLVHDWWKIRPLDVGEKQSVRNRLGVRGFWHMTYKVFFS